MFFLKSVVIVALCFWVVLTTVVTLPLEMEYKWQAWAIVTWGPVIVVAGLWEVVNRVCGGRGE